MRVAEPLTAEMMMTERIRLVLVKVLPIQLPVNMIELEECYGDDTPLTFYDTPPPLFS